MPKFEFKFTRESYVTIEAESQEDAMAIYNSGDFPSEKIQENASFWDLDWVEDADQ